MPSMHKNSPVKVSFTDEYLKKSTVKLHHQQQTPPPASI